MKKILIYILILFISISFVLFLVNNKEAENVSDFKVITSNYALQSISEQLINNDIQIKGAYDFSKELHDVSSLTSKDLEEILNANVFICISEKFEPFVSTVKDAVKNGESEVKIIEIGELYNINVTDQHLFISPKQGIEIVNIIDKNLKNDFPGYKSNHDSLISELEGLNKQYEDFASNSNKTIFVEHDAYFWLREDYGLDIKGIKGVSHESETSANEIKQVIEQINEQKIKYIYNENQEELDSELNTIVNETGVQVKTIDNLEVESEMTYTEVLENNLKAFMENND